MKPIFSALLTTLVVVSLATGGAVAQDAGDLPINQTETPTPDAGVEETHERIDNATRLVSTSYGDGTATVVIESDIPQQITLTDSGAFVEGGEVPQRSVVVKPDERVEISMPVTEADGFVGVSITTQKTLYAVPLESVDTVQWFNSESTWQTVQVAALGGASGVLVVAALVAYRLRHGGTERTERIA